ncbi:MAG: hypothetical protein AB8B50_03890 [Pirellulaceae bacterium]
MKKVPWFFLSWLALSACVTAEALLGISRYWHMLDQDELYSVMLITLMLLWFIVPVTAIVRCQRKLKEDEAYYYWLKAREYRLQFGEDLREPE